MVMILITSLYSNILLRFAFLLYNTMIKQPVTHHSETAEFGEDFQKVPKDLNFFKSIYDTDDQVENNNHRLYKGCFLRKLLLL